MRSVFTMGFFMSVLLNGFAQGDGVTKASTEESTDCCCNYQEYFPGGMTSLHQYFLSHPISVKTDLPDGRVKCYMRFVINETGTVTNVEALKSIPNCPECEQACVEALQKMPEWNVGFYHGKPTKTLYHMPIRLMLVSN